MKSNNTVFNILVFQVKTKTHGLFPTRHLQRHVHIWYQWKMLHWNGNVVRMTALCVTGDVEGKLQRPQWRSGQWRPFRFSKINKCQCFHINSTWTKDPITIDITTPRHVKLHMIGRELSCKNYCELYHQNEIKIFPEKQKNTMPKEKKHQAELWKWWMQTVVHCVVYIFANNGCSSTWRDCSNH